MRVGYARVSRQDQKLEPQRDTPSTDDRQRIFGEKVSSARRSGAPCWEALDYCREGDVPVARLDRPGRSPRELIDLEERLEGRGVGFQSPKEALGTTTAGGGLIFHVLGALAELGDHPREDGGRASVGPDAGSRHRGHGKPENGGLDLPA